MGGHATLPVCILYRTGSALLMILYTAIFPRSLRARVCRRADVAASTNHQCVCQLSTIHSPQSSYTGVTNYQPASQPVGPDPQSNGQVGCGNNRKYSLWAYIASSGQMDWRTVTRIQSAYRITKQQSFVRS